MTLNLILTQYLKVLLDGTQMMILVQHHRLQGCDMKRKEMLMWLQRHYGIRHCMVDQYYITIEQFCDEVLSLMESKGMLPPIAEFKPIETKVEGFDPGPQSLWANKWEDDSEKE